VAAASAGCYGARQYVSPVRSVLSRAEHDEALLYDRSAYQEMRGRGINIRYPHLLTFDLGTTFSTALCAFDNTRGAPPWYPLGRRQDNAFRRLAGICDENAVFTTLPAAARHDPAHKHPFSGEVLWEVPVDLGIYNELILAELAATPAPSGSTCCTCVGATSPSLRAVSRMSLQFTEPNRSGGQRTLPVTSSG